MPIFNSQQRETDARLAYVLLRATLGVNILLHGVSRLLAGPGKFVATLVQQFHGTPLPQPLVVAFAYTLPWIEAAIGALVLVGLFTRFALTAGALLILVLTFGATLQQAWDIAGIQLVYALAYAALLAFLSANRYSVDAFLNRSNTHAYEKREP
jgi:thiosulfate dehydrogenase (quinone) large subunit